MKIKGIQSLELPHRVLMRIQIRMIGIASLIGIVGGLGAVLFRRMISFVNEIFVQLPKSYFGESVILTILAPGIGGLIVGFLIYKFASEAKGHGVPEIIESVNLHHGRMRLRVPFIKIIASAITIGTGGSAGREGPIAQIGGGFASLISQKLKLSKEQSKILVVSGVASGIAATFNAPIGGVLFGLEILPRDGRSYSVFPLVVSSVIATSVGGLILGDERAFIFPSHISIHPAELPANLLIFLGIGVLMGLLSVLWIKGFYLIEDLFEKIPMSPILVAGIGGILVGIIEVFYPEVSGVNYDPMNAALALKIGLQTVIILVVAKFLATSASIGSGGSGGVFAPTLFQGLMLGTALGFILNSMGLTDLPVQLFAFLAMAGLFAGTSHAPLTSIIFLSEIVGDFNLFLPLMFVVITSWAVAKYILEDDIYIIKLKRRGIKFKKAIDILEEYTVDQIMSSNVVSVSPYDRVEDIIDLMKKTHHHGFPVVKDGILVGVITSDDIDKVIQNVDMREWEVAKICTRKVISVHASSPVSEVLIQMAESRINRFPVVSDSNSDIIIGWITRTDIMSLYRQEKRYARANEAEKKLFHEIENNPDIIKRKEQ